MMITADSMRLKTRQNCRKTDLHLFSHSFYPNSEVSDSCKQLQFSIFTCCPQMNLEILQRQKRAATWWAFILETGSFLTLQQTDGTEVDLKPETSRWFTDWFCELRPGPILNLKPVKPEATQKTWVEPSSLFLLEADPCNNNEPMNCQLMDAWELLYRRIINLWSLTGLGKQPGRRKQEERIDEMCHMV